METSTLKKNGHGPNVRLWREWRKMSQETLAELTGYSQAALSGYEKDLKLKPEVIEKLAKALEIPVEAITEMGTDNSINIISSTLHDNSGSVFNSPNFNPLDKVVELYEQKEALYERMLKEKEETITLLHEVLKDK